MFAGSSSSNMKNVDECYYRSSPAPTIEITVISAEGLKKPSSSLFHSLLFSNNPLKTFITLSLTNTTLLSSPCLPGEGIGLQSSGYNMRTDSRGGNNLAWGETFQVPINPGSGFGYVLLRVYKEVKPVSGSTLLGWCHIPLADIVWPPTTTGSVRFVSYRLRAKDGTRSLGIVNLAMRLQGTFVQAPMQIHSSSRASPVIGIPVSMLRAALVMNREK